MPTTFDEFVLGTNWIVPAPVEAVWTLLHDTQTWPRWWKYVKRVTELEPGDEQGVGARHRFEWATRLPYRIVFEVRTTRVRRPVCIEGEASGDLTGIGRWHLRVVGEETHVHYEWRVRVDKTWMRRFAPWLRPIFVWNHAGVMRAGEAGLRRELAAQRWEAT